MKSFSTTLTTGGFGIVPGKTGKRSLIDIASRQLRHAFKNAWNAAIGGIVSGVSPKGTMPNTEGIPYNLVQPHRDMLINHATDKNNSIPDNYSFSPVTQNTMESENKKLGWVENPFKLDDYALKQLDRYKESITGVVNAIGKMSKSSGGTSEQYMSYLVSDVAMSMFNQYNGVNIKGITSNTPLYDDISEISDQYKEASVSQDYSNCSIQTLVKMSRNNTKELGVATYKYADFMYCKDLGLPNNRLITLRRFSSPVGDNIFTNANNPNSNFDMLPDIGRMLCYFDTEDNKLEEIMKYTVSQTWKKLNSDIQKMDSKEDNRTSPLGMVLNTLNPQYNKAVGDSYAGDNNLLSWMSTKMGMKPVDSWYKGDDAVVNPYYDQNKVYTPKNTIQEMYIYEGKLEFKHSFKLTFRYNLRSYSNVNAKAAFLDLLANILATTYSRGTFWGGKNVILGAQPNYTGWKKANAMIDNVFDLIGSQAQSLASGDTSLNALLGSLSNGLSGVMKTLSNAVSNVSQMSWGEMATSVFNTLDKTNLVGAFKGKLKDRIGRPQMYAFNSLLTGDNTGVWHVTIGNPRNPIAAFGNLIMTDCSIQHLGPLGVDDFPTEIKVDVTLEHARPRDSVEIEKMYNKGQAAIYIPYGASWESKVVRNKLNNDFRKDGIDYWGTNYAEKHKRNCEEIS